MALFIGWCLLIFSATYGIFGDAAIIEASSGNVQDSTLARLANLEAKLETVLEKNVELEKRIEVLEKENERLHELATAADTTQTSTNTESQEAQEVEGTGNTPVTHIQQRKANVQVARRGKVPRILLSDDSTVAFTATISHEKITTAPGQTIIYDRSVTNFGQAYNPVTGIFTAPVGGVYVFTYDSMVLPSAYEYLELVRDGLVVLEAVVSAFGESHYATTSRTAVLQVDQGTTVWIRARNTPGTSYGYNHSSFSGWMLAALPGVNIITPI